VVRVSDYTVSYQIALVITLIYTQQVKYILTFMEIKSYIRHLKLERKPIKTMHKDVEETTNII